VVAHELAHLDSRDTVLMILGVSVAWAVDLVIAILASGDDNPAVGVVGTILGTVAHVVVMLFVFALSRSREYAADAAAARTLGRADPLVRALRRIEETNEQLREFAEHGAAVGALGIVSEQSGLVERLLASHPPVERRVERLRSLDL
jgi:heat shock protein HtpX